MSIRGLRNPVIVALLLAATAAFGEGARSWEL